MDDDTKSAIDSLMSGMIRKRGPATRTTSPDIGISTATKPFYLHTEGIYKTPKPTPSGSPTFCFNASEKELDLKEQIATLSVDTASASIVLKAPLTDIVIKRVELAVPITQREWLPVQRAWRFSPSVVAIIKPILKDIYKDVQMLGVPKALPSTKFDQLIARLSIDDKAAVYKLLASRHHPDKGGSHEVMTLINLVFRG